MQTELIDGRKPKPIHGQAIDSPPGDANLREARLRFYDPWQDRWKDGQMTGTRILLADFSRSIVVRLECMSAPPQR
ncbi:MAG TPA: hypothetical protein P5159_11230 [Phycisphaerae bacterium]|nr:hypothetical protein [Phycisphaerae bacterium]